MSPLPLKTRCLSPVDISQLSVAYPCGCYPAATLPIPIHRQNFSQHEAKKEEPSFSIGSMYGIYGNIYHQYTPVMLALTYHTWILWDWRGFHRFPSDPSVLNLSCQMLCDGSHGLQLIESTQRHRQASLFCRPMGTTWYNLQLHQMRMIKSHDKS